MAESPSNAMSPAAPVPQTVSGALRVARVFGIDVFVHWSWVLVGVVQVQLRSSSYSSWLFSAFEYLALFAIVLLHEFGHALACRSVGGQAERIVLWPLGGIAYVSPPQRPGALLWSIAAGPLVNVVLIPVTLVAAALTSGVGGDVGVFFHRLAFINGIILVFNMLPIYPLDGGQILRALLWFVIGRARSLMVAAIVGFVGAGVMVAAAIYMQSLWFGVLAFFNIQRARSGYTQAKALKVIEDAPRHVGFSCPECKASPPMGPFWRCACGESFDTFAFDSTCPKCSRRYGVAGCPHCAKPSPRALWSRDPWTQPDAR